MEISDKSIKRLSDIQYLFARTLLQVGKGTPKAALLSQTGLLGIKQRIAIKKLTFINAIKHIKENTLAKQILLEQIRFNYPGMAMECKALCLDMRLEDITVVDIPTKQWKAKVKEAAMAQHVREVKDMMTTKCENIQNEDYREMSGYFTSMSLTNARMAFRIKSKMIDLKAYYKVA